MPLSVLCVEGRLQGEGKNRAAQVPVQRGGCFRQAVPAPLLRPEAPEYFHSASICVLGLGGGGGYKQPESHCLEY